MQCVCFSCHLISQWNGRKGAVCLCYFYILSQFKLQKNMRATSGRPLQPQCCKSASTASSDVSSPPPHCCKLYWSSPFFFPGFIKSLQIIKKESLQCLFLNYTTRLQSVCSIQCCGCVGKLPERPCFRPWKTCGIFFSRITSFFSKGDHCFVLQRMQRSC